MASRSCRELQSQETEQDVIGQIASQEPGKNEIMTATENKEKHSSPATI